MFGIDEGPSSQEKGQYNNLTSENAFATRQGEGDITAGQTFMRNILSGDPTLIAKSLAPEISAGQQQVSQAAKTNAEFGTRSGGTTAATNAAKAGERGNIINLVGGLQSGTASNLGSLGTNLFSAGQTGTENAFSDAKTMQAQDAAKWNDIASSIGKVAAAPFTGGASLGFGSLSMPGRGGGSGITPWSDVNGTATPIEDSIFSTPMDLSSISNPIPVFS